MKKILFLLLSSMMILNGCSNSTASKPAESTKETTAEAAKTEAEKESTEPETTKAPKEIKTMSVAEFDDLMAGLPVTIIETKYVVQDDKYKSLYPDMLTTVIQNNTEVDIKDAVLGLVAWDSNNLPVKIVGQMDFTGGDYFIKVNYGDINLVGGSTFGDHSGFSINEDCHIATFKPIVLSFETFDGDTWKNPYVDSFKKAFEGKKYSDDITIEAEIKNAEFISSETPAGNMVEAPASDELGAALANDPLYVSSTNYVVQDDNYKSLYPDMLQAILQNNSEEDIRDAVVAFVAWDENGLPVKIKGSMSFNDPTYVVKVSFDGINVAPGGSFGDSQGYSVDEKCGIKEFKAIVVSYTTFEDKKWENPNYKKFLDLYEGKRLVK